MGKQASELLPGSITADVYSAGKPNLKTASIKVRMALRCTQLVKASAKLSLHHLIKLFFCLTRLLSNFLRSSLPASTALASNLYSRTVHFFLRACVLKSSAIFLKRMTL